MNSELETEVLFIPDIVTAMFDCSVLAFCLSFAIPGAASLAVLNDQNARRRRERVVNRPRIKTRSGDEDDAGDAENAGLENAGV